MKMMELLQEKLEKKIGDEWVGIDGDEYELIEDGLLRKGIPRDEYVSLAEIDEWADTMKEGFTPKLEDTYYHIGVVYQGFTNEGNLTVKCREYNSSVQDEKRIKQGNYFETFNEAEKKLEEILKILSK